MTYHVKMRAVWERVPEDMKGWSPAVDVFERGDGIVATGWSHNGSVYTMLTVKYSPGGAMLWEKRYTAPADAQGRKVKVDGAGNVIVTGSANGTRNQVKMDAVVRMKGSFRAVALLDPAISDAELFGLRNRFHGISHQKQWQSRPDVRRRA